MADINVLATIANAIATQEGYGKIQSNGIPTRPTRNNNPGDIKSTNVTNPLQSDGTRTFGVDDAGHVIYPNVQVGQAALYHQIDLMLTPGANSHFNPDMTIAEVGHKYAADPNWATGVARTIDQGKGIITPDTKLRDVEAYIQTGAIPPNTNLPNASANGAARNINLQSTDAVATDYANLRLPTDEQLNLVYQDMNPDLVIEEGLNVIPWYKDDGLITGNPRIRKYVTPVSFKVLIKDKGGFTLANPDTGEDITVQLNASLKTYSKSSKHVYTKTNTRTGIHLTFWGMQADIIEGTGSTGVFMNQLGITDFFSTVVQNDELTKLLAQGFAHVVDANTGDVVLANAVRAKHTNQSNSAFRVAAQDAFVELLSLFKNNGNIYFRRDNYTGQLSDNDQAGVSAWSPKTGLTTQQGNSRNNDVMTRGNIAMQLKDNTYLGYFKAISWVMDANNPFQWHFNFVFQVERTITLLEYPRLT